MRIAPVGVICAGDPERAAAMAEIDASISHYADGIWGAQAVAAAVSIAMVYGTMDEITAAAMKVIPKDSWLYASMNTAFEIVDKANGSIIDAWMPLHDTLRASTWATTAEAIPSAFACLRMAHGEFKKDKREYHGIFKGPVVDTTAAGDTFTGYFIASVAKDMDIKTSLKYSAAAASIAVSRLGAACSIPAFQEVIDFIAAYDR